jgi:hypothetical protein
VARANVGDQSAFPEMCETAQYPMTALIALVCELGV